MGNPRAAWSVVDQSLLRTESLRLLRRKVSLKQRVFIFVQAHQESPGYVSFDESTTCIIRRKKIVLSILTRVFEHLITP